MRCETQKHGCLPSGLVPKELHHCRLAEDRNKMLHGVTRVLSQEQTHPLLSKITNSTRDVSEAVSK